jgi:STE24 endopeptidase
MVTIEKIKISNNYTPELIFKYKEFAIAIKLIQFILELFVDLRQYFKLSNHNLPEFLKKLDITSEEYIKGKIYKKEKMFFSLCVETFKLLLDIILLYYLFLPYEWKIAGNFLEKISLDPNNEFYRAYTQIMIGSIRELIISIPISYYSIFVIEEKHGFNKQTIGLFVYDTALSFGLTTVITFPILWGFLNIVEYGGEYFFIYVEIFIFFLIFAGLLIWPNFIAPLFNKFEELENGSLKDGINKLAADLKFPVTKVFVCDGSKRSGHSNAYFYGFGSNKRIVLYDTLIKQMKEEEILAVLCHELGHWQFNHFWIGLFYTGFQVFVLFYIFSFFRKYEEIYLSFGFEDKCTTIGLMLFSMIYSPVSFFLEKLSLKISRKNEFEADSFAYKYGYHKELCNGLIVLNKENKSDMDPDSLYSAFNFTHPTLMERLNAIEQLCVMDAKEKKD